MEEFNGSHVIYKEGMRKRYPVIVKSEGVHLFDQSGKRYLDMGCATGAANTGYGQREILAEIQAQLGKHCFAQSFTFSNEPQEALAKKISWMLKHPTKTNLKQEFTSQKMVVETLKVLWILSIS